MVYRLCVYHVILFVRMWVEMYCVPFPFSSNVVILFVRMWVEMYAFWMFFSMLQRHPLREDVSWNISCLILIIRSISHPLREDVSWNVLPFWNKCLFVVILFVRMWDEISRIWLIKITVVVILFVRMWVEILSCILSNLQMYVILFVRMWVEMFK